MATHFLQQEDETSVESATSQSDGTAASPLTTRTDTCAQSQTLASTDAVVASHLLHGDHIFPASLIQTFLDVLNDPNFDESQSMLRSPSDAFEYVAQERESMASRRVQSVPSLGKFPIVILDNVIEIVERNRPAFSRLGSLVDLWESDRSPDGMSSRNIIDPAHETLNNMSFVHRLWTRPAQKSIGRRLIVNGSGYYGCSYRRMRKALVSSLFGPWTKGVYICCFGDFTLETSRLLGTAGNSDSEEDARRHREIGQVIVEILRRLPCLEHLALGLKWSSSSSPLEYPFVFSQVATLTKLRRLEIKCVCDNSPELFAGFLSSVLTDLPNLERFLLEDRKNVKPWGYSGWSDDMQSETGSSWGKTVLSEGPLPKGLREIKLTIGDLVPLDFISWLFGPYARGRYPRLFEHFDLVLTNIDRPWSEIDAIYEGVVTAIDPTYTLSSLRELTVSIEFLYPDTEVPIIVQNVLRSCTSIHTLRISHLQDDLIPSILQLVPPSIVNLHYSIDSPPNGTFKAIEVAFSKYFVFRHHHAAPRRIEGEIE